MKTQIISMQGVFHIQRISCPISAHLPRQGLSHRKTEANALMVTDWKHIQAECHFRHKRVALVTYIFSTEEKTSPCACDYTHLY